MRNKIILLVAGILCFFLQCTLMKTIAIGDVSPNLLIILVVSMGLMRGSNTALFLGFFVGLLADIFYGEYLGIYAFLYMVVGYVSGCFCKFYYDNNVKVPMALTAGGDLIYNLGVFLLLFLLRGRTELWFYVHRIMVPELIYTIFLTALVYKLIYYMNYKLMKKEKKEGNSIWLLK